ncbi:MAG: hypothetical protein K6E33_07180 [Lachnospiraceae bacterium]|nr:hypothetical protein [Lachnospiraceae bacterium]
MGVRIAVCLHLIPPDNWGYVQDILSYVTTGARSVENQQHRLTMSGIGVAAGMKNPTSGDLSVMLNSIYAAQKPHHFIFRGYEVETDGNPYAHSILRGAVNRYGRSLSNYHYEDINMLLEMYRERDIVNPAVVIDTNHNNSDKKCREQIRIVKDVLHNRSHSEDMRNFVKGVMVESYIVEGCQKIGDGVYGKSITDPCLGWADTEKLIYDIADRV